MVQAIALGLVASLSQARQLVKRSVAIEIYEPVSSEGWEEAWQRIRGSQQPGVERRLA